MEHQAQDFKQELIQHIQDMAPPSTEAKMLITMPANTWLQRAMHKPSPTMLFDELWFEGELCILFADANAGKSILAVQIANSISKSVPVSPFRMEAEKQKVLYIDFEQSEKQFELRYSDEYYDHYSFDTGFYRAEINTLADMPAHMTEEEYINKALEDAILDSGAKVVIIDNITYLRRETEKAKDALPLMKHLKKLKSTYNLSILALAHTPKRDSSKPITANDLQGSKMLINFCDSSFAIGKSQNDNTLRYLKQIKVRNAEERYHAGNVCLFRVNKPFNFVQFEFQDYAREKEHLAPLDDNDKEMRIQEALELRANGHSNREIARQMGVSETAVRKWFKKHDDNV